MGFRGLDTDAQQYVRLMRCMCEEATKRSGTGLGSPGGSLVGRQGRPSRIDDSTHSEPLEREQGAAGYAEIHGIFCWGRWAILSSWEET